MINFYSVSLRGFESAYYTCQIWAQRELCMIIAKSEGCFPHEVDLSNAKIDIKSL